MARRLGAMLTPSSKPISRKLQVKPGNKLVIINAPKGYMEKIVPNLPKDAEVAEGTSGKMDVIQIFVKSRKELESSLPKIKSKLRTGGSIWVTYPKETSTMKADVNRDVIREYAPRIGMEAVAIFSVDDVWSALRLKMV